MEVSELTTASVERTAMNVNRNGYFLAIRRWLLSEDIDCHAILAICCTFAAEQLLAWTSANTLTGSLENELWKHTLDHKPEL